MAKLGFTFYPKDWWTSDTYFEFDPFERYVYLECMFLMYANEGYLTTSKDKLELRLRTQIKPSTWEKITQHFTQTELGYTLNSITKRRSKAEVSRDNGKKGGRPKKPRNPGINLPLEGEREREGEIEGEREYKDKKRYRKKDSESTPDVVASAPDVFLNSSSGQDAKQSVKTEKEKEKIPGKRKRKNPPLPLAGLKRLPILPENRYVNAAIYFYSILAPVHGDKHAFKTADANKWAADLKTLEVKHERNLNDVFEVVKWALENTPDTSVYLQSPSFLIKTNGANYDRLIEKQKVMQKEIDRKNGVVRSIELPKVISIEEIEREREERHRINDLRYKKLHENDSI